MPPVAAPQQPKRLARLHPFTIVRVLVVLVATAEFVGVLIDVPSPAWLHLAFALGGLLSILLVLWKPLIGASASILPVSSLFMVADDGYWQSPAMVCLLMVAASARPRTVALVITAFFTALATSVLQGASADLMSIGFVLTAPMIVIGLVVRKLLARSRRANAQIDTLVTTIEQTRADERSILAGELSSLLIDGLTTNDQKLLALSMNTEAPHIRAELAGIEHDARTALARLRGLVATLRKPRDNTAALTAPPRLTDLLDDTEDLLVGHGYPVHIDTPADPDTLPPVSGTPATAALTYAVDHVRSHGTPGGTCTITLTGSQNGITLKVSHPSTLEPDPTTTELRELTESILSVGGTLDAHTDQGIWILTATLPNTLTTRPATTPTRPHPGIPWPRIAHTTVSLIGITGLVYHTGGTLTALRDNQEWQPSLNWALTMAALTVCVRWPRTSTAILITALTIGLITSPTHHIGAVALLQTMGLAAVLIARSPRWVIPALPATIGYYLLWDRGVWGIEGLPFMLVTTAVGAMLGLAIHHFTTTRRTQLAEITRLEHEQAQAREQERHQLAGELHDIVAHQLSLMTMHLMAHEQTNDLDDLHATTQQLRTLNHSAQADLNTLVTLMREHHAPTNTALEHGSLSTPTATARAVAHTLTDAGHQTTLTLDADADDCDPTTARTLTRILREGTTNILRYAPTGAECTITLTTTPDTTTVTLTNTLPTKAATNEHSTGLGLIGLTERVTLTGGTLTTGPHNGHWHLTAALPR